MPKRVFVIHGMDSHPKDGWFPWLEQELEARGFAVNVPNMPCQPPAIEPWTSYLRQIVGKTDKDTFFIGHSAGCITILRYLESLPKEEKIGGAIFVAGWIEGLRFDELKSFFNRPILWRKIKEHSNNFVAVYSDNDTVTKPYHAEALRKNLGAKKIIEFAKGHLSGKDGVIELPTVLRELLRIGGTN